MDDHGHDLGHDHGDGHGDGRLKRSGTIWNDMKRSGTVGHGTITVTRRFRLKTKDSLYKIILYSESNLNLI
jgi:hypothetical protein